MKTMIWMAALLALAGCPKGGKGPKIDEGALETNPAANFQVGLNLLQNPDKKTGAIDYQTAYTRFSAAENLGGGAKASFNAGWVAEVLGKMPEAEGHYRKAYEANPSYEAAMFSLARVLEAQGKTADAVALYKSHADKNPNSTDARNDLVSALIKAGQHDQALAEAQEILRRKPDDATVYRNLSALYYAKQNYSLSQLTAEKALELNEGDPGVYNNMGVTYLIQGDEPAAIEKFKTAIKLQSTNFESNMNLGFVALNSGDYTLAKTCFDAATQSNPASLDAKLGLAVASRGMNDYKAAGDLYDQILAVDPQYDAAYFNAAILHEKYTKDFPRATKYLQSFIDAKAGTIPPTHEVFARMENVKAAQAAEEERKRIEAEKIAAEKERQKRNEELLANMATVITDARGKLTQHASCLDAGSVEEVTALLDQAQTVVDSKEVDMAADIQSLLDAYLPALNDAIAACGGGAPAPAPAPAPEGGTP